MPPKERKSISQWMSCQNCGCVIGSKDITTHSEKNCPPAEDTFIHGYIKDNSIYSCVDEVKSDAKSLKHIPAGDHSNMVLLSQQAMQLCNIGIGDPALVKTADTCGVRTAWPTQDGSLTSVFLTLDGLDLLDCKPGARFVVCRIGVPPLPAVKVQVTPRSSCDLDPSKIAMLLEGQQQGRAFQLNNMISLRHLGGVDKFEISKVFLENNTFPTDDNVISQMQNLSLDPVLFAVYPHTTFCLNTQQNDKGKPTRITYSLASVGGLDATITELQEMMQLALSRESSIAGFRPSQGVLLFGVPGVGKTLLAQTLGETSGHSFFLVKSPELFSKFYGETEARVREIFKEAIRRSPSVIFIDEVDILCQKRGSGGSNQEQRVVATLLAELDGLQQHPVMVIAATSRVEAIDEALRRPGRLDREIEIPVPDPTARQQILKCFLANIPHQLTDAEILEIAKYTHGFVGADLLALCSQAAAKAARNNTPKVCSEHFDWARSQVKPSAMREVALEIPAVRWTDIGGQHDLKQKLQQAIEWPLKHPEAFSRLGIRPPRGVLMYGPPGCSKTMIARALATESGLNFLSIKGPELFSKWVGESERAVRAVFRRARQVAPAIVFFDELDALCGERGASSGGSNVQERVLAQLLTELDGVEPLGNVIVVAATNRPDRIDKALLRPGRLDRIVHVPLPDAATRREIFNLQFRKTPVEDGLDISTLVNRTEGYSGAEVTAVCQEAALAALQENIAASKVEWHHFEAALKLVTPRTPSSLLDLYAKYHQ